VDVRRDWPIMLMGFISNDQLSQFTKRVEVLSSALPNCEYVRNWL